jgi:hypothetical protein
VGLRPPRGVLEARRRVSAWLQQGSGRVRTRAGEARARLPAAPEIVRRHPRAAVGALAAAGIAAAAAGLVAGGEDDRVAPPEGGSRFGARAGSRAAPTSLLDALAPVLLQRSGRRTSRAGNPASPLGLPVERAVAQLFAVGFRGTEPAAPFFTVLSRRDWGVVLLGRSNYVNPEQLAALAGEISVVARAAGHTPPLVGARQAGAN